MSRWSMTAMSPGCSRLVRFLVRPSTRATPTTPGAGVAWARGRRDRRRIGAILPRQRPPTGEAGPGGGGSARGRLGEAGDVRERRLAQLLGVRPRGLGVLLTCEHAGQLGDPLVLGEGA